MGRYWDGEGPQQEAANRLHTKLVPASGPADTLEGECLRAAGKVHYEFFNNGGGNNVSGPLLFLRQHLPDFDWKWWDTLAPYVTGEGALAEGDDKEAVLATCEALVDATITYVASAGGRYVPSPGDMWSFEVKATGHEIELDEHEFEL